MQLQPYDSVHQLDDFQESEVLKNVMQERKDLRTTRVAAMKYLPNLGLATACTDGKVRLFDRDLRMSRSERLQPETSVHHLSAIGPHPDGCVVGTTGGALHFYDSIFHFQQKSFVYSDSDNSLRPKPKDWVPKQPNLAKIKYLAVQDDRLLVALPRHLQCWDRTKKMKISQVSVSKSDEHHLYSIEPLINGRIALAIGTSLEIWRAVNPSTKEQSYIKANVVYQQRQDRDERICDQLPYIASTALLGTNRVAMALFSGLVKVTNVERGITYAYPPEHSGVVWSVCRVSDDVIATGDTNGMIKLWDVRESMSKPSSHSIDSVGFKVMALVSQNQYELFSSTEAKGTHSILTLWDIRMLSKTAAL